MTAYDKANWHYDGEYPGDLSEEHASTHIGMFMAWALSNDLLSQEFFEDNSSEIKAVKNRTTTGRLLVDAIDGKFIDEDLNEEGQSFAEYYYSEDPLFYRDYEEVLAQGLPSIYHVGDTWDNYDKLAPRLDERFKEWKNE